MEFPLGHRAPTKVAIALDTRTPTTERQNDRFLMAILRMVSAGRTKVSDGPINRCRVLPQVITLSDITGGTGKYILEDVQKGSATGIRDQTST
jgi:hypothetical protein